MSGRFLIAHNSDPAWTSGFGVPTDTFFYLDDGKDADADGRNVTYQHIAGTLIVPPCQEHYLVSAKATLAGDLQDDDKDDDESVGVWMTARLLVGKYRPTASALVSSALLANDKGQPVLEDKIRPINRDQVSVHLVRHHSDYGADGMAASLNVVTAFGNKPPETFSGGDWLRIDLVVHPSPDAETDYTAIARDIRITATAVSSAHGGGTPSPGEIL